MACVKDCPCKKKDCENNGKCCNCVKRHKGVGNLPFCLRPENQETEEKKQDDA